MSGGTALSIVNLVKWSNFKKISDPLLLCRPLTDGSPASSVVTKSVDPVAFHFDRRISAYAAPFVMAGTNTRVVRRSASLFADAPGV